MPPTPTTTKIPTVTITMIDGDAHIALGYRPGLSDGAAHGWTVLLGVAGWVFLPDYRIASAEVGGQVVSAPCADCGGSHFRAAR